MPIEIINTGTSANAGNGDSIRTAFNKVNQNFNFVQGLIVGTSTNFNSSVRQLVKPMLVHDAHNGMTAAYNPVNDRIILSVGNDAFTITDLTALTLTVVNTATIFNAFFTGTVNFGFSQGFDDVNVIRFSNDSVNFRVKNTYGLGRSEINLLDSSNIGSFNILHQNISGNSGLFSFGQNYIFDDQGRAINIGRASNINFYARQGWASYTNPEMIISNTGTVSVSSTLTLAKNFIDLAGQRLKVNGTEITVNDNIITANTNRLIAGNYTATLTTSGNIVLPGQAVIQYNQFVPGGQTVTNYGAIFSADGPFGSVGSLYFDGTSRVEVNGGSHFDLNTGSYTIEWFQKPTQISTASASTIFILGNVENQILQAYNAVQSGTTSTRFVVQNLVEFTANYTNNFLNTWTHVAYVKTSSTFKIFLGGVQILSTGTALFPSPITTTSNLVIGSRNVAGSYVSSYTGYISNMRWQASALYNTEFSPPTSILTASTNTRLLLATENFENYLYDSSVPILDIPQSLEFVVDTSSLIFNQNGVLTINQNLAAARQEQAGNLIRVITSQSNYTQAILENNSPGTTATTDLMLIRDNGNSLTGLLDIGINSSGYSESDRFPLHSAGSAYMFTDDADLIIGTQSLGKKIVVHAEGTTSSHVAAEITATVWKFFGQLQHNSTMQLRASDGSNALPPPSIIDPPISATAGSDIIITAGNAGDNDGNLAQGALGGNILLESGISTDTSSPGGEIRFRPGGGNAGPGNLVIDLGTNEWTFNSVGQIQFPDSTIQVTAWTGDVNTSTLVNGSYEFRLFDTGRTLIREGKIDFGGDEGVLQSSPNVSNYNGEKIVLNSHSEEYSGEWHTSIGEESGYMWFSYHLKDVPGTGFKWYGQDSQLMKLETDGNLTVQAIISATTMTMAFVMGNLIPNEDLAYDLGSTSSQWRSLYVGTSTIYLGGTALSISGGNLTIDGSPVSGAGVLWGSSADSGDGNNYDTIKLIPDAELFANGSNQYLIVDPTNGSPGHIHIRAGGTQDSSSADLYLGGEQTFVRVSDTYDNVSIGTTGTNANSWIFDSDGALTLPSTSTIFTNETELNIATSPTTTYTFNQAYWEALNGNASRMLTPSGNGQYFSCTVTAQQDGTYTVDITGAGNSFTADNWFKIPGNELGGSTSTNDLQITVATVGGMGEILTVIVTGSAVGKQWTFGPDGGLTFPDGTTQTTAYGFVSPPLTSTSTGSTGTLAVGSSYLYVCTATNSWQRIAWDTNPW